MLKEIQKANIKSFLETDYQLAVQSIHNEKYDDHYKVFCEYASQKVVLTLVKNKNNDKNLSIYQKERLRRAKPQPFLFFLLDNSYYLLYFFYNV